MIWVMLTILSLPNASNCDRTELSTPSISEAARMGAAIVSDFLQRNPSESFFSHFHKATKVNGGDGRKRSEEIVLAFLRLFGFEYGKISDFAFDGVISLVRLMSKVLIKGGEKNRMGRTERRTSRDSSWFRFLLNQPQFVELLEHMQDPDLVDLILKESVRNVKKLKEDDAECIWLLVCKTKPFVRGMQRSLRFFLRHENPEGEGKRCKENSRETTCSGKREDDVFWEKATMESRMFFFVPSLREVIRDGDKCDQIFPNCEY